jgi:hypothetical protein
MMFANADRLGLVCGEFWFLFCTSMALASASDDPGSRALVVIFGWGVSGAVAVVMLASVLAWIFGGSLRCLKGPTWPKSSGTSCGAPVLATDDLWMAMIERSPKHAANSTKSRRKA